MSARASIIAVGLVTVLGVLAFGGWYFLLRGEEPPPVSLETALQAIDGAPGAATGSTGSTGTAARADAAGAWAVEAGASFVGYRVNEQLAHVGANTAVGRTSTVAGELHFDGARVTTLRVTADLRNLRSDDSRRDNYLRQQSLQTSRYPEAAFVLAEPIAVSVPAAEGATMSTMARGDLTVHGVTRRVEVPVEGKLAGGKLAVVGSTKVALADFEIAKPRVPSVLSIEDDAVIEWSLVFVPAG